MRLTPTPIPGLVEVQLSLAADDRGTFRRLYEADLLESEGLFGRPAHVNVSHNPVAGTLRGLHYQAEPQADAKIVSCIRGAIWDVVVDLRTDSVAFRRWHGLRLDERTETTLVIPEGCAHGFVTLEPDSTVHYIMSVPYVPELARGVRWNDRAFSIDWPVEPTLISERDAGFPDFVRSHR